MRIRHKITFEVKAFLGQFTLSGFIMISVVALYFLISGYPILLIAEEFGLSVFNNYGFWKKVVIMYLFWFVLAFLFLCLFPKIKSWTYFTK